jgi:hypothetical protein
MEEDDRAAAEHWVRVYDQLIAFELKILERMRELAASQSQDAQQAVRVTNIEPMEELIAEFQRRRDLWAARRGR